MTDDGAGERLEPDGGETADADGATDRRATTLSGLAAEQRVSRRVAVTLSKVQLTAAVSSLMAVLAALVIGSRLLGLALTALALASGGLLALGLYALNSDRLWLLLASGVILTPASVLLAAALGVSVSFALRTGTPVGHLVEVTVLLLVFGGFAAVLTAVPLSEGAVLAGSFVRYIGMLVPLTVAQFAVVAVVTWESTIGFLARLVVDSPEPLLAVGRTLLAPEGGFALLTLLVYPLAVLFLFRLVVRTVPLQTLFPPRQRPTVIARIDDASSALGRVVSVAALAAVGIFVSAALVGATSPAAVARLLDPPFAGVARWLLSSVELRVLFVLVMGAMAAILVGERLRRLVRRRSEADLLRPALPAVGAVSVALLTVAVLSLVTTPERLLAAVPASVRPAAGSLFAGGLLPAVLLVAFGSLIVVGALFIALTLLAGSPILPERALGPALASTSVFGLALVLVLFGGSPALAFITAALALVVWDAGEFAVGVREELPLDAPTTRGEVVHVGASLAVGLLAVGGAFVLEVLIAGRVVVPAVTETALAAGALTLAFGTVVFLASVLRE
ncbi:hypothetical protein ACFR9U_12525 [Halorientalis brevis]|uniref:Uncharacterized protein n=1 Tax=Halorientalis brevis TaxID=1126241 RepID=A0ABD6CEN2_9EURY|nr:hypothetical protein [Halorientalis brevis]